MRTRQIVERVFAAIFVVVIAVVGLKSCTFIVWQSPTKPSSYGLIGQDGRAMQVYFLPNNEAMVWYAEPQNSFVEGVLTKMRGTYGTHYVWRLWHVEGPGVTFGYRIYPADTEPVMMEITVLDKFIQGRGDPTFPSVGKQTHHIILFGRNAIRFQDMWMQRQPDNPEAIAMLQAKLGRGPAASKQ